MRTLNEKVKDALSRAAPCPELRNEDSYCKAWEPKPKCGGCYYWDGGDCICRSPESKHYMAETDDGCERREG